MMKLLLRLYHMYVLFAMIVLAGLFLSTSAYADVISPVKQYKLNFSSEEIVCKEDLVKIYKKNQGKVICVNPASADRLVEYGWAATLSTEIKSEVTMKKGNSVGEIKTLWILKHVGSSGKLDTSPRVNMYNYVFEACAASKNIRAPEIIVTSDSDTKSVKLVSMLKAEECRTSSTVIKAKDPESISAVLLNKGGISKKIIDMETRLADLLAQVAEEKKKLKEVDATNENAPTVTTIHQKISELKKDIAAQRYDLQKHSLLLFAEPIKSPKIMTVTSTTGKPVVGLTTNLVSITKQVAQPMEQDRIYNYNVIFEACTDNTPIKVPVVAITTDHETKSVRLADKIIPNSCQVSVAKILAKDKNTISLSISEKTDVSSRIADIDTEISSLLEQMKELQIELNSLISAELTLEEHQNKVSTTTNKITDLRTKTLALKAEKALLLVEIYR